MSLDYEKPLHDNPRINIQENKKKPDAKKKTGGFQAKMEEITRQKQQQQLPQGKKK